MVKFLKYTLLVFAVLVVVLAGIIYSIDVNQYKGDIINAVTEKTGRDFFIEGDLGLGLSFVPTVEVEGVRLGNAPWGSNPDMLRIGRFAAEVSLLSLLRGVIQVNRLLLTDAEIFLETDSEGNGNWVMDTSQSGAEVQETPAAASINLPAFNISEVKISGVEFTYQDGKTGNTTLIDVDEISTRTRSFNDPTELVARASYNNIPVTVSGTLGPLSILAANEAYPVELNVDISSARLGLVGKVEQPLQGKGINLTVSFAVDSLTSLNQLADTELPDIGPVAFTGLVIPGEETIQIKSIMATAGQTDLAGEVTLQTGGQRPTVTAILHSRLIDLTPFTGGETPAAGEKQTKEKVFSSEPIPLEALKIADAGIQLDASRLKSGAMILEDIALSLQLQNGRLSISPLVSRLAGGTITVNLVLDAGNSKAAALQADINVQKLELGKLPQIKKDQSLQGGMTDIDINISGDGNSVAEIMAGLNGTLLVQVGAGTLTNSKVDLVGADLIMETFNMLNPLADKEATSALECAVVNINIKDGMATVTKGIALQTSKMYIVGDGSVDLKTETLDMSIKPHARRGIGIGVGSLANLVKLSGTLANPRPVVDAGAVLEAGISAGSAIANAGASLFTGGTKAGRAADQNPCDVALGKAPAPAVKNAGAETTTSAEPEDSAVGTTVKGATDKVKGIIKGLFGGG